ncbi:WhiB family transcriptional regulator [Intrasporangium calvum]|uniref:WhiB family transcriptional regulator n=1 Tax=Intrasporangium calvum TaxID=53358 RepID=A0ABT5GKN3_9MICO|nr:WhiB family transcriptional regulator [Intrasporangium calvum]MDC5698455.1 WhiB family transcriptional regulator [Intrasporangium calvum]
MSRHRINLTTRPLRAEAARARSRDPLDGRAFTAATEHPLVLGEITPPCTAEDPELFWPATESEVALAKAVCRGCPVRRSCLAVAQERREWGVWGGELLGRGRPTKDLPGNVRPPQHRVTESA